MSLQNAFAIGSCNVRVDHRVAGTLWNGALTPGQSSPTFTGAQVGEVLQTQVNSDGTVQLNWVSGGGPSDEYFLSVVPTGYSLSNASQVIIEQITNNDSLVVTAKASTTVAGTLGISLTGSGSTWTPDPCDITTSGNRSGLCFYQGRSS